MEFALVICTSPSWSYKQMRINSKRTKLTIKCKDQETQTSQWSSNWSLKETILSRNSFEVCHSLSRGSNQCKLNLIISNQRKTDNVLHRTIKLSKNNTKHAWILVHPSISLEFIGSLHYNIKTHSYESSIQSQNHLNWKRLKIKTQDHQVQLSQFSTKWNTQYCWYPQPLLSEQHPSGISSSCWWQNLRLLQDLHFLCIYKTFTASSF